MTSAPEAASATGPATARQAAAKLAEYGVSAANAYGRPDLAERLGDLLRLTSEPTVRVLVAGEFKQGKSSLVNALVGTDVCPIDDDVATSVATAVGYSDVPEAFAVFAGADAEATRRRIDATALPSWVTETGELAASDGLQLVEVGAPADALRGGLVLVDLPGAGGLGSFHGAATLASLRQGHGVMFVSDVVQELTATEAEFLVAVSSRCSTLALVKSKTDIHPAWRRIVEADRERAVNVASLVIGVSAELAAKGRESADDELVTESGILDLAAWLRDDVLAHADLRLAANVAIEIIGASEQIRVRFEAERAALEDGADRTELEAGLEAAREDSERLRTASTRWQQVMVDAFADIASDVDHDLQAAVRELLRRSEAAIESIDPATGWEEYEPALRREVSTLVADHYMRVHDRVADAARRVTDVFQEDAAGIEELMLAAVSPAPDAETMLAEPADLDMKRMGIGGQALGLVRAAYGQSLMVGFIGGVAGLTIAAPAMLAIGLLAGTRGFRQEKDRQLSARRAQAKAAARRFIDETIFEVAKDARDELRLGQRALRDHFTARANELVQSAAAALKAAQDATGGDAQTRAKRRADIDAELERIAWLSTTASSVYAAVEADT